MRPIIVQRGADFVNQEVVEHSRLPDYNQDVSASSQRQQSFFEVNGTLTPKRDPLANSLESQSDHFELVSQTNRFCVFTRLNFGLEESDQHPRSQEPRKARDRIEQGNIEARRAQDVHKVEDLPRGKEELLGRLAKRRRRIRVRIMQKYGRPINRNLARK